MGKEPGPAIRREKGEEEEEETLRYQKIPA
jgi:hypothetical protein